MTNDKNTPGHGSGATTAQAIASAVGLGVLLLVAAFIGYALRCWGNSSGECAAIRASPPWTLMTTMAAAPCVLLTWYWRTEHKKRDILDASRAQIAQRFATAVEMLDKGGHTTIGAIYALEQIAQDSPADHWTIVETLAAFVRNACLKPASSGDERRAQVQAAISVLGRRRAEHDPEGATIDLREASLWGIKFDGLNFARANFEFAKVNDSTFFGTDLSARASITSLAYGPMRTPIWRDRLLTIPPVGQGDLTIRLAAPRNAAFLRRAGFKTLTK